MPTEISFVNLQYKKTIGRGEQFGPGFTSPVFVARGKEDMLFVLCRASEYRPEGTRVTVCTTNEEYITAFARGVPQQGPHDYNFDDGSLVWPTFHRFDNVMLLVFTEFGRRVHDNGSGTDHGSGGHAFVVGEAVKGGLYGEYPSLEGNKLMEGDLQFNNDFRGLYSTILEKWMGLDAKPIVNGTFEQLDFI